MNKPDYPHPDMGCPDLLAPNDAPSARLGPVHRFERWVLNHSEEIAVIALVCLAYWLARN